MADDVLNLLAGGRQFTGWKSVAVRRSMVHCTGGFELGVSWRGDAFLGLQRIRAGEACEVRVGDVPVITGYVDGVDTDISAQAHEVRVHGRDKTADLVDCSAIGKGGQWRNRRIEQIVADLAAPFGISVRALTDTGKALPSFALQEGETAFEAADRAARIRALLLVSEGDGSLAITRAGQGRAPTPLVLGVNMLRLRSAVDMRDRYSQYVVKGQAPGTDFFSAAQVSQMKALADDPGVSRYRPLVITNDQPDLAASLRDRARWEANVRAARSMGIEVEVQGWHHASGLWEPNTLVRTVAQDVGLDDDLLITEVQYEKDDRGTTARLMLTRADAYTLLPLKAAEAGRYWDAPKAAGAN